MLKNYLKIAWRNLWKHKLFSFINVFGLALSLAVCIMVIVQVKDDLSYDRFHPHVDRIYRIISNITENKNNKQYTLASTPLPLQNELLQEKNSIEAVAQIYPALKTKAGDKQIDLNAAFTDRSFFQVFGFELSSGDKRTALNTANGIVLSKEVAFRFFSKENPMGKFLNLKKFGIFQVTGVLAKPPGKSHLDFDAYASSLAIPQLEKTKQLPELQNNWNSLNKAYTYVLLKNKKSADDLRDVLKRKSAKPELKSKEGTVDFAIQPLSKITPGTDGIYNEIGKGTVWAKVLTVVAVGFIILLAACFNYTNLTIARALTRAKEVGIRKVSGASRYQIFTQYIIESLLIAFIAFIFACLALAKFKPDLSIGVGLYAVCVVFTLVTGVLAGTFPAWILSAFKSVQVLKGVATQKLFGNISLQKGLLVFQFSLSILVVIFLSAYYRQFSYMETLNPGFYSKHVLVIPVSGNSKVFTSEISRIGGVEKIAMTSESFGLRGSGSIPVYLNKSVSGQGILSDFYFTDAGVIPLHQLQLTAGTNFSVNQDYQKEKYIIINEKAAEVFGIKNPITAVGKTVWLDDSTEVEIKGVIKNFYDKGVARNTMPLLLRNRSDAFNYIHVAVNAADEARMVKEISTVWHQLNPHVTFEYDWLDKKIAQREDQSDMYSTMGFLAFITITIASLGLLGLVIYTVETRQKEMSVRKVIGATTAQLMFLLSKGFVVILVIAGLIAMPIGYISSVLFLQNFANRVPVGLGTLLFGFVFLLSIGLVAILFNTYKASMANPVKNLRSE